VNKSGKNSHHHKLADLQHTVKPLIHPHRQTVWKLRS